MTIPDYHDVGCGVNGVLLGLHFGSKKTGKISIVFDNFSLFANRIEALGTIH